MCILALTGPPLASNSISDSIISCIICALKQKAENVNQQLNFEFLKDLKGFSKVFKEKLLCTSYVPHFSNAKTVCYLKIFKGP